MSDQEFLKQFEGKTITQITAHPELGEVTFEFTDGSSFEAKADTKDSVFAIQEGWGEYTPVIRYKEVSGPRAQTPEEKNLQQMLNDGGCNITDLRMKT